MTYEATPDALFRGWPIAVLVDRETTCGAEWLAAALQDNHRATIVGTPTASAFPARILRTEPEPGMSRRRYRLVTARGRSR